MQSSLLGTVEGSSNSYSSYRSTFSYGDCEGQVSALAQGRTLPLRRLKLGLRPARSLVLFPSSRAFWKRHPSGATWFQASELWAKIRAPGPFPVGFSASSLTSTQPLPLPKTFFSAFFQSRGLVIHQASTPTFGNKKHIWPSWKGIVETLKIQGHPPSSYIAFLQECTGKKFSAEKGKVC
jgi:hypothetical protein